jgi:hypothetical protein
MSDQLIGPLTRPAITGLRPNHFRNRRARAPLEQRDWAVSGFVESARDVVADIAERIGPDVGNGLVGHGAAALDSFGDLLAKLLLGLRESLRR